MPTILILVDWFLPAYKAGGPIQSLHNLVSQDDDFHYCIVCSNKDLDGAVLDVPTDKWIDFNKRTKVWYCSKGMERNLLNASKNDVLFINGIYSWQYNIKPILFAKTRRKIVSVRGMLHPGALSQKAFKKNLYLRLWKLFGLHKKVEFHASDVEEKGHIQAVFGRDAIVHVAANFPRVFQKQGVLEKRRGELQLISIALISPMKNISLVLQALRNIKANIHYHVYGPVKDGAYWQACKETTNDLPANVQVIYHGDVHPLKVEEALQDGHVFILPSKSENFGHAICEALSAGKPVVTSNNTPWRGLQQAAAGLNVSIKNEQELTKAVDFFADMDKQELETWSDGAKAYADAAINLDEVKRQYRKMFGQENTKTSTQKPHEKAL